MAFLITGLLRAFNMWAKCGLWLSKRDSTIKISQIICPQNSFSPQRIFHNTLIYRILWGKCSFGGYFAQRALHTIQRRVIRNESETWCREWGLTQGSKTWAKSDWIGRLRSVEKGFGGQARSLHLVYSMSGVTVDAELTCVVVEVSSWQAHLEGIL